jgi:hypothetical protein
VQPCEGVHALLRSLVASESERHVCVCVCVCVCARESAGALYCGEALPLACGGVGE